MRIRTNQVGYAYHAPSEAIVLAAAPLHHEPWQLTGCAGGRIMRRGVSGRSTGRWSSRWPATYHLKLGAPAPGSYRLRTAGQGSSCFRVASPGVLWRPLLGHAVEFLGSQRDGSQVPADGVRSGPSHVLDRTARVYAPPRYRRDGVLRGRLRPLGRRVDVDGGWFDAGDYLKFVQTASYTTSLLLLALRDRPQAFPDLRAARVQARVGIDWLLKMWDPVSGTLYAQVGLGAGNNTTILGDHDAWRLPQDDDRHATPPGSSRYFISHRPVFAANQPGEPVSPNLAGRVAAAFALCAQLYAATDRPYAKRCLHAGQTIYAQARTSHVGRLVTAFPHEYYPESQWADDMELAAAELARADTHNDAARARRYRREGARWAGRAASSPAHHDDTLNLYDVSALGHYELTTVLPAGELRRRLAVDLKQTLRQAARLARHDPFSLPVALAGGDVVPHALGVAVTARIYRSLTGSTVFDALGRHAMDWVLGANPWGMSFIVAAGRRFPRCTQSQIANLTVLPPGALAQPGAVVDGPALAGDLRGLDRPGGARPCPSNTSRSLAIYDGRGVGMVDDTRSWPTDEPADDYVALTFLTFAGGPSGQARPTDGRRTPSHPGGAHG